MFDTTPPSLVSRAVNVALVLDVTLAFAFNAVKPNAPTRIVSALNATCPLGLSGSPPRENFPLIRSTVLPSTKSSRPLIVPSSESRSFVPLSSPVTLSDPSSESAAIDAFLPM